MYGWRSQRGGEGGVGGDEEDQVGEGRNQRIGEGKRSKRMIKESSVGE